MGDAHKIEMLLRDNEGLRSRVGYLEALLALERGKTYDAQQVIEAFAADARRIVEAVANIRAERERKVVPPGGRVNLMPGEKATFVVNLAEGKEGKP